MNDQVQTMANAEYNVIARFYDLLYADQSAKDEQFYLDLAQATPGPVLELGCGTGRISLPLARAGHSVVGLDLSSAMLDVFRAKLAQEPEEVRARVSLLQGDMSRFELEQRFGLIITPFRGFQHLITDGDQRACLMRVVQSLQPAGRFVLNMFDVNLASLVHSAADQYWRLDHAVAEPATGGVLRRYHIVECDLPRQVNTVHFRYELHNEQGRLTDTWVETVYMRWWTRSEMRLLLELCGLAIEAEYGAYDKSQLDERSRELIIICRRTELV